MENRFFEQPILNSPYDYPARHWELDNEGQPTLQIINTRRSTRLITPIPKPRERQRHPAIFEELRSKTSNTTKHQLSPGCASMLTTGEPAKSSRLESYTGNARLLQHWRHYQFNGIRPFFCQIEAVETAIWLTEVAPKSGKTGSRFLEHLANANHDANPELMRLALKLAGAGKTTVMAMLIAWQTINSVRRPTSKKFTRGFLVVTPGITIRDRFGSSSQMIRTAIIRVARLFLLTCLRTWSEPRSSSPTTMPLNCETHRDIQRGRALLQGRGGEALQTLETEGQMLQRVMPDLMGLKPSWR